MQEQMLSCKRPTFHDGKQLSLLCLYQNGYIGKNHREMLDAAKIVFTITSPAFYLLTNKEQVMICPQNVNKSTQK